MKKRAVRIIVAVLVAACLTWGAIWFARPKVIMFDDGHVRVWVWPRSDNHLYKVW